MLAIIIILFFKFKKYTSSTAVFKLWYLYDDDIDKRVADNDYANLNVKYFANLVAVRTFKVIVKNIYSF